MRMMQMLLLDTAAATQLTIKFNKLVGIWQRNHGLIA